jgi:hypothetical protein
LGHPGVWQAGQTEKREKVMTVNLERSSEVARRIAAYWRWKGFPFHDLREAERLKKLKSLLDFDHTKLIEDYVVGSRTHGLALAGSYFARLMNVQSSNKRTPLGVFNIDDLFAEAIQRRIEEVGREQLTENDIRKACQNFPGTHGVSNFRPTAAAAIYDRYIPERGGVTWDMSAGWGGRMLGALACKKVRGYIGCDPATETCWSLAAMASELVNTARRLGRDMGVEIYCCGSEDMRPNLHPSSVDFCFSSPPYFSQEKYSDEETQSYLRFRNPEAWLNGFMGATLDNCKFCLKPNGILAVNIAKVPAFPDLEQAFMGLATSRGWRHIETLNVAFAPMWGTRKPGQKWKYEPLFVFQVAG